MDRPLDDQPDRVIARRARAASGEVVERRRRERPQPDEGPSDEDIERFGGVTVTCRHCGATLHDDVAVCWKYGLAVGDPGQGRRLPVWALVALGLCVVVLVMIAVL